MSSNTNTENLAKQLATTTINDGIEGKDNSNASAGNVAVDESPNALHSKRFHLKLKLKCCKAGKVKSEGEEEQSNCEHRKCGHVRKHGSHIHRGGYHGHHGHRGRHQGHHGHLGGHHGRGHHGRDGHRHHHHDQDRIHGSAYNSRTCMCVRDWSVSDKMEQDLNGELQQSGESDSKLGVKSKIMEEGGALAHKLTDDFHKNDNSSSSSGAGSHGCHHHQGGRHFHGNGSKFSEEGEGHRGKHHKFGRKGHHHHHHHGHHFKHHMRQHNCGEDLGRRGEAGEFSLVVSKM